MMMEAAGIEPAQGSSRTGDLEPAMCELVVDLQRLGIVERRPGRAACRRATEGMANQALPNPKLIEQDRARGVRVRLKVADAGGDEVG